MDVEQEAEETSPDVSLDDLNDSELRLLCEDKGSPAALWTPRQTLLDFLAGTCSLPSDPMTEVRIHQVSEIMNRLDSLRAQMPQPLVSGGKCEGCCFDHDDMRVVECQVQNTQFRHPNYPKSK